MSRLSGNTKVPRYALFFDEFILIPTHSHIGFVQSLCLPLEKRFMREVFKNFVKYLYKIKTD